MYLLGCVCMHDMACIWRSEVNLRGVSSVRPQCKFRGLNEVTCTCWATSPAQLTDLQTMLPLVVFLEIRERDD